MKTYMIDHGCKLCDACYWACPQKAIYIKNDQANIDQGKCAHCGICYECCANEAISMQDLKEEEKDRKM